MVKKLKKLLAVTLALSMTMGLLNLTVLADGEEHPHDPVTCSTCGGSGKETEDCPGCEGTGELVDTAVCSKCAGSGLIYDPFAKDCEVCHGASSGDCPGGCSFGYPSFLECSASER